MLYYPSTFVKTYSYWYAMMREVAALFEAGNFRGVCPIYKPGVGQHMHENCASLRFSVHGIVI